MRHQIRFALLFALGALPLLVYWTGTPDAMTWPKWAVIALLAPLCLAIESEAGVLPPAPIIWVIVAASLTTLWTQDRYSAVDDVIHMAIMAAVFWLGYQARELRALWLGIAAGITVNVALVVFQAAGFVGVPQAAAPAGFLVNRNFMGEACALAAVFAIATGGRWRWWAVIPLVGLAVTGSKAGAAGLACSLAVVLSSTRLRPLAWAILLALTGAFAYMLLHATPSMAVRLEIWFPLIGDLSWLGHGLASFAVKSPYDEWAHNELLHAVYEQGIFAIPAICLAGAVIWKALNEKTPESLVVVTFAVIAMFGFPLHVAATAYIGVLATGWISGRGHYLRHVADSDARATSYRAESARQRQNAGGAGDGESRHYIPVREA